jgi:NAD(P)H dehydrogenase (quinone)
MVTFGRAIRLEQMNNCTNDFEKLTGKKPVSVREVFKNIEKYRIGERTSTD